MKSYSIKQDGKYTYIDEGRGDTLLLLHGLFGALSNWDSTITACSQQYRVIIPVMPIYTGPRNTTIESLTRFVEEFVTDKNLTDLTILGNSLGGHIGLVYALQNMHNVSRIVLTGSSGLFENSMGNSYPKRGTYDFVQERVRHTFYDPEVATESLIKEVFETTRSIGKCMRMVSIAKSAQRSNLAGELYKIEMPVLLIWGLNDTITPPHVGHEFHRLLPQSDLHFIDKCCHAPMMERPDEFNRILRDFLEKTTEYA